MKHLLKTGQIGSLELKNRMVLAAMGVNLGEDDGSWGERIRAFYEAQAKGGVGLIISGACGVMYPVGQVQEWQLGVSRDEHIEGIKAAVDAVHAHGSRLAIQLHQGGLNAVDDTVAGRGQWCPSAPTPKYGDMADGMLFSEMEIMGAAGLPTYRVMTKDDIDTLVQSFADGAVRAKAAGCDAVEVHGAHGYVPSSFMSPATNRRTDEYGGSLENRARLLLEIVRAVRKAVGGEFPIIVKIDAREVGKEGGIVLEDAKQVAQWLEAAGADAITVSAYHDGSQGKLHSASNIPHEPNTNLPAAEAIKRVVSIPVIASGRVEPTHADQEIAAGKFDFLAMGRKLLADPDLPIKLIEDRTEDIRPCIYCYTCVSNIYIRDRVACAVNPECSVEYQRSGQHSPTKKKHVAVIGGGPGGMEAARRLALSGHRVSLFERANSLGGTLRFASIAYKANEALLKWLTRQVEALNIEVHLNSEVTVDSLKQLKPDEVVVATGALRNLPPIKGSNQKHVFSGDDMRALVMGAESERVKEKTSLFTRAAAKIGASAGLTANLDVVRKVTHAWMPLGKNVVIIGGELVGLELAEFLAERGRTVTVVDEAPRFGVGLQLVRRLRLLAELREHGLGLYTGASDIWIDRAAVCFKDAEGNAQSIASDHVIVAKGAEGDSQLADAIRAAGLTVQEVGDGTGVGYINGAMRDAMLAVDAINS